MNYIESAIKLGEDIAASRELQNLKEAEDAFYNDPKAQTMMDEYQKFQHEMVHAAQGDVSKEGLEEIRTKLAEKQQALNEYETTKKYIEATNGFQNMMKSINEVLQYYVTGEEPHECNDHDCSSCGGGCHH